MKALASGMKNRHRSKQSAKRVSERGRESGCRGRSEGSGEGVQGGPEIPGVSRRRSRAF